MYSDYSKLFKTYDVILSNAVLNVMPQDQRDALVAKMGEMLNPGGRMIINVRGIADVEASKNKQAINAANHEWFIPGSNSYQKGFTHDELIGYLQDALGPDYEISPLKRYEDINFSGVVVEVRKNADAQIDPRYNGTSPGIAHSVNMAENVRDHDYSYDALIRKGPISISDPEEKLRLLEYSSELTRRDILDAARSNIAAYNRRTGQGENDYSLFNKIGRAHV